LKHSLLLVKERTLSERAFLRGSGVLIFYRSRYSEKNPFCLLIVFGGRTRRNEDLAYWGRGKGKS